MALLEIGDLFPSFTRDSVVATLLEIASDVGLKVTAWQEGQPYRTHLVIVAQKIADFSRTTAEAIKGGLLESASEGWLTILAWNLYRVERTPAEAAAGYITITNASAEAHGPIAPGDFIVAHSVTGKTYTNQTEITIPAGGVLPDVAILAEELGTESNAGPGLVTELVSSLVGVTVTNPAAVLGADEETDDDLRQRCRDKLGALSPDGPREAYAYVAKTPALAPVSVPITRVRPITDPATGHIRVILATAAGAPSAEDVEIVDEALDVWATPLCVDAEAEAAAELEIPITCQVWIKGSSLTVAQIQSAISSQLATFFRSLDIGGDEIDSATGRVDIDHVKAQIFQSTPGIKDVAISSPAGDVVLDENEVAKLGAVNVTVTVVF